MCEIIKTQVRDEKKINSGCTSKCDKCFCPVMKMKSKSSNIRNRMNEQELRNSNI